jgi:hypothetical protein
MSALYEGMRAEVDQLLAELGRPVKFQRFTYINDLVEGTSVPSLQAEQELNTATLPATVDILKNFEVKYMDGVEDKAMHRFALVSAEGAVFAPEPKDSAVFDGKTWEVIGSTAIDVDGTAVVYGVGLRARA